MRVWCLNHCIMISFIPQLGSRISADHQHVGQQVQHDVMMDLNAYSQHMNVPKHIVHICKICGEHSIWVWSLNHWCAIPFLAQVYQNLPPAPQIWPIKCGGNGWWWIHPLIHGIVWLLPHTLYMFAVDEANHLIWVWSLNQCTIMGSGPKNVIFFKWSQIQFWVV